LQLNNLYDMQHMWYEVRSGDAYMAAGQLPKALKKYTSVAKHFAGRHSTARSAGLAPDLVRVVRCEMGSLLGGLVMLVSAGQWSNRGRAHVGVCD
jgi:hypothetical protein